MPGWENFFVAQVGASAALAGLVFVGISINLTKIVATADRHRLIFLASASTMPVHQKNRVRWLE